MGTKRTFKTGALAEVNEHILSAARDSISQEQTWDFFCECGREGCAELVQLTTGVYVSLRDRGDAVLAPGHRLSRAERARRQARELREDSEALRAQAEHQVRRAKKTQSDASGFDSPRGGK
jgi:hypothetical protein